MKPAAPARFPLVIAAPSGGGKTTVRAELLRRDRRFDFSITCTTRPRRPGEKHGKDYYFVTTAEFEAQRRGGKLLEWARVHGNLYGTPVRSVKAVLDKGRIPVMTIDVKGARSVKRLFPETVTVFVIPPDPATLVSRLRRRGEPEDNIRVRLETAKKEMTEARFFDYLVINDDLEGAVSDIVKIVDAEGMAGGRRAAVTAKFAESLRRLKI